MFLLILKGKKNTINILVIEVNLNTDDKKFLTYYINQ